MSHVRLSVGIDIAKDSFQACLIFLNEKGTSRILANKSFANRKGGFEALDSWVKRMTPKGYVGLPTYFVMEATGVYSEQLSYFLHDLGLNVSVQLASNVKNFAKSHNQKTKTDKVDAQMIAKLGIERTLSNWTPPKPVYRLMRQLTRERAAVVAERTVLKNQEHALKNSYAPNEKALTRLESMINFLDTQITDIESDIKQTIASDADLAERVKNVCTIKGIELISAATVISEYNGFELFTKKGQVVSFAGLDVVKKESGKMEDKSGRISKKGNTHVRRVLYMPALSAIRWDANAQNLAERITDRTNIKMKGVVAVQRKLLILIYKLFVNNIPYDQDYQKKQVENNLENVNELTKQSVEAIDVALIEG